MTAWLPEAVELDAYEGIWRGDEAAFKAVAEPLQPVLRRLAGLYGYSRSSADAVVVRTWEVALHGLEGFRWHTPLATWIARITVTFGRTHERGAAALPAPAIPPPPTPAHAGPPDWTDLPWGARWDDVAWSALRDALAALPLGQREVVHGRDVERWPPRRVCDVFGLPEVVYDRRLVQGRTRLRDALGQLVGQAGPSPHDPTRIAAVTGMLELLPEDRHDPLDPRAMAVFRRWQATRHTLWRRLTHPLRQGIA